MKGRLLSVEEVGRLKESDKKYYVEANNKYVQNGLYSRGKDKEYLEDNEGHSFYIRCINVIEGGIKVYEYEEIVIKEYTTAEVLGMITENRMLRFKTRTGDIGFETNRNGESYPNRILWNGSKTPFQVNIETLNFKWTLVVVEPVEVSFMEAIKAYDSKGKTIKVDLILPHIYKYTTGIMLDENGTGISCEEIVQGKWFIL